MICGGGGRGRNGDRKRNQEQLFSPEMIWLRSELCERNTNVAATVSPTTVRFAIHGSTSLILMSFLSFLIRKIEKNGGQEGRYGEGNKERERGGGEGAGVGVRERE